MQPFYIALIRSWVCKNITSINTKILRLWDLHSEYKINKNNEKDQKPADKARKIIYSGAVPVIRWLFTLLYIVYDFFVMNRLWTISHKIQAYICYIISCSMFSTVRSYAWALLGSVCNIFRSNAFKMYFWGDWRRI